MTVDRSPSRLGSRLALAVAAFALAPALFNPVGVVVAAAGYATFAAGALAGSRRLLSLGAAALFAGVVAGTVGRTAALGPLLGTAAAVVAWDIGEHAVGLGEQVGREAPTRRAELAHAAASGAVGLAGVGAGYTIYQFAWAGQPPAALLLFLVAAILLTIALRNTDAPAPGGDRA